MRRQLHRRLTGQPQRHGRTRLGSGSPTRGGHHRPMVRVMRDRIGRRRAHALQRATHVLQVGKGGVDGTTTTAATAAAHGRGGRFVVRPGRKMVTSSDDILWLNG